MANYAEALAAFCHWCLQRGFLSEDPLKALAPFDTTPLTRRSLTLDDLDVERGVLHLDANWTKNRKAGVQPVPIALALAQLADEAFAASSQLTLGT